MPPGAYLVSASAQRLLYADIKQRCGHFTGRPTLSKKGGLVAEASHQALGTTESDRPDVVYRLFVHQRKRGITPDDLLEQHHELQPGQGRTDARVRTPAKGYMLARIRPSDVKVVGLGEQLRVVVGCTERKQNIGVGGDGDSLQYRSRSGPPPPIHDRGAEAQRFFDSARNQRGVAADRLPARAVTEQCQKRVGREVGGALVPCQQQSENQRADLVVG